MYSQKVPCVYILASDRNGTLYVGVTSNLVGRMYQHKNGTFEGFTSEHGVSNLMYYEIHDTMNAAITREKQIKKWNRAWKVRLIEEKNPQWEDLFMNYFNKQSHGPRLPPAREGRKVGCYYLKIEPIKNLFRGLVSRIRRDERHKAFQAFLLRRTTSTSFAV